LLNASAQTTGSLNATWDASATPGVTYNVYYAVNAVSTTTATGSIKNISTLNSRITGLQYGRTWCVIVTSQLGTLESVPTAQACVNLLAGGEVTTTTLPRGGGTTVTTRVSTTIPAGTTTSTTRPNQIPTTTITTPVGGIVPGISTTTTTLISTPVRGSCLDFDGDGISDSAVTSRAKTKKGMIQHIQFSTRTPDLSIALGSAKSTSAAADYHGNGKSDVAFIEQIGGGLTEWSIYRSILGLESKVRLDVVVDYTIAGCDFDGDMKADVAGVDAFKRNLVYLSSKNSRALQTVSLSALPSGRAMTDLSCADLNGDGRAELIVLTQARISKDKKVKTIKEDLVSAFAPDGKKLAQIKVPKGTSGLFTAKIAKEDLPIFGYFRRSENGSINSLSFIVIKGRRVQTGRLTITDTMQFTSGTFDRVIKSTKSASIGEVKVYEGLLAIRPRNVLSRLDLSDLKSGPLTVSSAPKSNTSIDLKTLSSPKLTKCVNVRRVFRK